MKRQHSVTAPDECVTISIPSTTIERIPQQSINIIYIYYANYIQRKCTSLIISNSVHILTQYVRKNATIKPGVCIAE